MAPTAIQLSPEERLAYPYLFSKADSESIGVLVGEKAVAFFAHSDLPPTILGEIWQLADQDNAGFLTRQQFDIALRLIGKAQRGMPINEQAISAPGPLCRLKGFTIPGIPQPSSPAPARPTSMAVVAPESAGESLYAINAEDKLKYRRMFVNAGPHDGLLDGDKARDIFIRSKLSFEKLGQIWALADTQSRGALSVSDFCIAMHLIKVSMSGHLPTLPTSLPSSLLDSATTSITAPASGAALPISRQVTGQPAISSVSLSTPGPHRQATVSSGIRPQYTGRSTSGVPSNLSAGIPSSLGSPTPLAWDISATELAQSNIYFDSLDTNRLGYITGDRAVPFMMESKLPGEVLARVWDLADIRGEGKLNREEFAVAMRLIQDTLAGGVDSLMTKLKPSMIPPSSRDTPALPAIPETSSTQQDLLSLMDDDPPNTAQSSSTPNPEYTPSKLTAPPAQPFPLPAQPTGTQAVTPGSRVVSPSSLSQGNLTTQLTDHSRVISAISSVPSLVEDNGAKLGNLVTQLSSTENALSTIRDERSRLQSDIGSTVEQIKALELKLLTARGAHQIELPVVEELRKKQIEQRSTISKLTSDLITAESELSSLKLEKEQIEGSILRDKEEVRETKKRMTQLEEETQQLKSSLELLKKDSRLQKGLLAIGKKQISTLEGQKDDISKEIDTLTQSLSSLTVPPESSIAGPASSASPPSVSLSHKSTNPFERMLSTAPASLHPSTSPSPEPASSHDLYRSPQATMTQLGVDTGPFSTTLDNDSPNLTAQSPVPFLSAVDNMSPSSTAPSMNTINFADAFGDEKRTGTENPSYHDHGVFHDALETTPLNPLSPSAVINPSTPTCPQPPKNSTQDTERVHQDPESDESSDEDEIEDPAARHLPPGSRSMNSSNFATDKFPALEAVEASVQSTAVTSPSVSLDKTSQSTNLELPDKPVSKSLNNPLDEASPPKHSLQDGSSDKLSLAKNASLKPDTNPMNFGDELEVSDFGADFGTTGAKLPPRSSVGATLEDFDSAFENLPLAGSTTHGSDNLSTNNQKNKTNEAKATDGAAGFDDGFDDAFVPLQTDSHQETNNFKGQSNSVFFDESFSDFDQLLSNNNNKGQDDKAHKGKNQAQDPFESPSSSEEPPALPARPTNSMTKTDANQAPKANQVNQSSPPSKVNPAKPTDSIAVQEICAMGFDRKVAIEALERDDWDMTRALNHLLGT